MNLYERSKQEAKEHRIIAGIMRLPLRVMLRTFRQKPIVKDGQKLHPEMQTILLLRRLKKSPGMADRPPAASRKALRRDARVHGLRTPRGIRAVDHEIPVGEEAAIKGRLYTIESAPSSPNGSPIFVFFHGGGFVLGDIDAYDHVCRFICDQAQVSVLSVDYRLAPEFPFPTGLNDCLAAYHWVHANADRLGVDGGRVAIGGDSAGANFATIIAQVTAAEGRHLPFYQWLIYPTVDRTVDYPSATLFADEFFLRAKDIAYFDEHYGASDRSDGRVSPIKGQKLSGLARTLIVTAGFDLLRDEGEAYAEALRRAGTRVEVMRFPGLIHGFINMIGLSPEAKKSFGKAVKHLKEVIHG